MSHPESTSPLRAAIEDAIAGTKLSMKDFTVLAPQNDPFRVDTPARHRDGEWLAITARDLGLGDRRIHLRGLHYMVIGRAKRDGYPERHETKKERPRAATASSRHKHEIKMCSSTSRDGVVVTLHHKTACTWCSTSSEGETRKTLWATRCHACRRPGSSLQGRPVGGWAQGYPGHA